MCFTPAEFLAFAKVVERGQQRKLEDLQHGNRGASLLPGKALPQCGLFLSLQATYAPAWLGDDLEPQQLLLGRIQPLHQFVHAVARHCAKAGLPQPNDVIEHCGRACILFGAPPPGVLDEVDGTQMPGIPVRQLGLLQPGDVGRLGPPPCHDATMPFASLT